MAEDVYGQENQPVLTGMYDVPAVDDSIDFKLAHVKQVSISWLGAAHDLSMTVALLTLFCSVAALCSWPAETHSIWPEKTSMSFLHSLHQLRYVHAPMHRQVSSNQPLVM
jgi:hypothetical protein